MLSGLKKGSIAIVDQILFSGSNFLVNLYLARILSVEEYGLFGTLYSIYILIFIIYAAFFLEPYIYYKNTIVKSDKYTTTNVSFSNSIVLVSLFTLFTGYILKNYIIVYFSFTLSTCIVYFYKRHYFSILKPNHSLYISIIYFIFIVVGLISLTYYIENNLLNCLIVLSISSILSIAPQIALKQEFRYLLYNKKGVLKFIQTLKNQKEYSFHSLTSSLFAWVPANIYFLAIPFFFGNQMNAEFKVLQNINLPIYHINIALVSLLIPLFIRSNNPQLLINKITKFFIAGSVLYTLIVIVNLNNIEIYIYGSKYDLNMWIIISYISGLVPEIVSNIYKAYFRSVEKPNIVSKINFKNMLFSFFCLYIVYTLEIRGVVISYILTNIFNLYNSISSYNKYKTNKLIIEYTNT